jgi:enediyne biosynthesis protein E4
MTNRFAHVFDVFANPVLRIVDFVRSFHLSGFTYIVLVAAIGYGCDESSYSTPANAQFVRMRAAETGIDFRNDIQDDSLFNEITYRNFYNGGGVAVGDINNDGLTDLFFTANQGANKLYLNKGGFRFEDITVQAGIIKNHKWSTGVTMADVNGDGLLDIYVCAAGIAQGDKRQNELYVNQGNLRFKEDAASYNLQDSGAFHTQAAFFDYDLDGDLDAFLLNNNCLVPVGSYGFGNARTVENAVHGDKLMRNDNGVFTDVSREAGIFQSVFGFGLGVAIGDINFDNWPDLYISNDFFEKDYFYINQKNGTFRESSDSSIPHMSQSSMGADMADINNDGLIDIFSTDMLPEDDYRLKKNTAFEDYDTYRSKSTMGFHRQLLSNMLHLNNGNNTFSEIAQFAGVDATDWSWGALIFDMNNDGWKDIFVCNGMYLDVTDQDYIAYTADRDHLSIIRNNKSPNSYELLKKMLTSQPIPNYALINKENLTFKNEAHQLGLGEPGFSNGAAYADLDQDGDLDLVINNLNDECVVYSNTVQRQENNYLNVKLKGEGLNRFGIGATVTLWAGKKQQTLQNFPTRGFQSCVEPTLFFGLGEIATIDSLRVTWPNNKTQTVSNVKSNQTFTFSQAKADAHFIASVSDKNPIFSDVTEIVFPENLRHKENSFVDFDQQRLIPHLLSTEGPKLSVADINSDGLDDIFIASAKNDTSSILIQHISGSFRRLPQAAFANDSEYEDAGSAFVDVDKDGDMDLVVASGGNLEQDGSALLQIRLYMNDGKGSFTREVAALPDIRLNASCVRAHDYDNDGDDDLFIGGRSIAWQYGSIPETILLRNDNGTFTNVTERVAPSLKRVGMVTDATWCDLNADGLKELVVVGEWMSLAVFRYDRAKNQFSKQLVPETSGWWNCVEATDIDNDGDIDLLGGNLGTNSKLKGDLSHPVKMFVSDFDANGRQECIITYYKADGKEYVYYMRPDLTAQIPGLKKKFLRYADYAGKTVQQTFTSEQLSKSEKQEAGELRSCLFVNDGKGKFTKKPLPLRAQFSPIYAFYVKDINGDGAKDIVAGGNLFGLKPELGRYDADYGTTLLGTGNNEFTYLSSQRSGIFYHGEVRDMAELKSKHNTLLLVARNNDAPLVYKSEHKAVAKRFE